MMGEMETVTLPKNVVDKMLAAIECALAPDLPMVEAIHVLEHYGWSHMDRHELTAKQFIKNMSDEALNAARTVLNP